MSIWLVRMKFLRNRQSHNTKAHLFIYDTQNTKNLIQFKTGFSFLRKEVVNGTISVIVWELTPHLHVIWYAHSAVPRLDVFCWAWKMK